VAKREKVLTDAQRQARLEELCGKFFTDITEALGYIDHSPGCPQWKDIDREGYSPNKCTCAFGFANTLKIAISQCCAKRRQQLKEREGANTASSKEDT
jgi:hypothetical protein